MVKKTLTYSSFALACLLVIVIFVTSKSLTQLSAAVFVYPIIVYFAYRIFLQGGKDDPTIQIQTSSQDGTVAQIDGQKEKSGQTVANPLKAEWTTWCFSSTFVRQPRAARLSCPPALDRDITHINLFFSVDKRNTAGFLPPARLAGLINSNCSACEFDQPAKKRSCDHLIPGLDRKS